MTSRLHALRIEAVDPHALATFWSALLGWEQHEHFVRRPDGDGFGLRFVPTHMPKTDKNLMHLDLTSATPEHQRDTVTTALGLGARHIDIGQRPEEGQVVLADPQGNEFCVIEAGNDFLAGCGFVGALACDGSQQVGHFWSRALDWPLVWDQDQETAIQAPSGGSKITWGGESPNPRASENRVRLELTPPAGDQETEVDRLVSLGAHREDTEPRAGGSVRLTDPDGNPFHLLPVA